jgi:hypothetical protein
VSEEERSARKIKVVDRRWFTEDGGLRENRPEAATDTPAPPTGKPEATSPAVEQKAKATSSAEEVSKQPRGQSQAPAEAAGASAGRESSPLFLELVATLAQQAEVMLVGAPGFPKQPDQAQRLIDYIAVLEDKTRGNLSAEESQILSNVLFQLRAGFVQAPKE